MLIFAQPWTLSCQESELCLHLGSWTRTSTRLKWSLVSCNSSLVSTSLAGFGPSTGPTSWSCTRRAESSKPLKTLKEQLPKAHATLQTKVRTPLRVATPTLIAMLLLLATHLITTPTSSSDQYFFSIRLLWTTIKQTKKKKKKLVILYISVHFL